MHRAARRRQYTIDPAHAGLGRLCPHRMALPHRGIDDARDIVKLAALIYR